MRAASVRRDDAPPRHSTDPGPVSGAGQFDFWLGLCFGLMSCLIWGIQPIASKLSIEAGLSAADVTVLRFLAGGLVLLPVALRTGRFPVGELGWRRALVVSALAGLPFSLVIVGGVAFAPALHSAVISPGLIPVIAMVLAYGVNGIRPGVWSLLALGLVLIGLIAFSWQAMTGAPTRAGAWRGDLLFVLSALMWAMFGFLANRWKAQSIATTASIAILSLGATPLLALVTPLNLLHASVPAMLLQAIVQGVLVGVVALYLYTRTVVLLGAVQAAFFLSLVPVVTAVVDILYLGEYPSMAEFAGMLAVIAGMTLSIAAPRGAMRA